MPETDKAALRPRAEIQASYERIRVELEENLALGIRGESYTRGKLTALEWVLGTAETSPLTGRLGVDVTDRWALGRDQYLATDMLYGHAELDRRGREYVVGVEHALMWVRQETDSRL